ncbi:MAG: NAD+ synthase [Clostridia bacterium]|nr:NAD+ synthase [Clostridia bacterium]
MRIAVAQINPTVGDFPGNIHLIKNYIGRARKAGADLVVFPEMAVSGYPPKDLLCRKDFINAIEASLTEILAATKEIAVLVGTPVREADGSLINAAVLMRDRNLVGRAAKTLLPEYDVFDERRYFAPGFDNRPLDLRGMRLGVTVCEDIWNVRGVTGVPSYPRDPVKALAEQGADFFINLSASPYHLGKQQQRLDLVGSIAARYSRPFLYVNQVGGNDDLVFDGASFLVNSRGQRVLQGKSFDSDFWVFKVDAVNDLPTPVPDIEEGPAAVYQALALGLGDYLRKIGYSKAVVGLSGGIDSAVTAALAVAALGSQNVLGVSMPSRYSSRGSVEDSRELAKRLGIEFRVLPIEPHFQSFLDQFNDDGQAQGDLAEENIQARLRGNILMFISNREGYLVLSTGNKSETAVGYSTLYGDMAGGLAVLADVPKVMVYELAAHINRKREIIPHTIIHKAPSAELRPGQVDQDSLPPYPILDGILKAYIEDGCPVHEIVARGYAEPVVRRVTTMVDRAEYKRRQAAPGLKITSKAFGSGRRYPIAHRWTP